MPSPRRTNTVRSRSARSEYSMQGRFMSSRPQAPPKCLGFLPLEPNKVMLYYFIGNIAICFAGIGGQVGQDQLLVVIAFFSCIGIGAVVTQDKVLYAINLPLQIGKCAPLFLIGTSVTNQIRQYSTVLDKETVPPLTTTQVILYVFTIIDAVCTLLVFFTLLQLTAYSFAKAEREQHRIHMLVQSKKRSEDYVLESVIQDSQLSTTPTQIAVT